MRKKRQEEFDVKMEMTPLIDCVFLLIMFFILTTQITVNIEELTLPFSLEGKPQKTGASENTMLLLNVVQARSGGDEAKKERRGEIRFGGKKLDSEGLKAELAKEVEIDALPKSQGGRGRPKEDGPNNIKLSQLEILIRYDREVRAEYLREIFEKCQEVGVYKLKIATMQPQDEG